MLTIKRVLFFILAVTTISVMSSSFFLGSAKADSNFETKRFDVEAELDESNAIKIRETIKVNFTSPSHGITRGIPYKGTFKMKDKSGNPVEQTVKAGITDVKVAGENVKIKDTSGKLKLRIGDPNELVEGEKTYEITYKVQLYKDDFKDYDFLYLNILPHQWSTVIEESTLKMIYPKEFNAEEMSIYLGYSDKAQAGDYKIEKRADGKVEVLYDLKQANSGVTIFNYFEEGYFTNVPSMMKFNLFPKIAAVATLLLSVLLWFLFGRDPKTVKTVEFHEPKNMDPVDVAFALKGLVENKDITAEIVYFASKGYLTITEIKKKAFILKKIKDINPEEKLHRRTLFEALFRMSDEYDINQQDENFWMEINEAKRSMAEYVRAESIERTSISSRIARGVIGLSILATLALNVFFAFKTPGVGFTGLIEVAVSGVLFVIGAIALLLTFDKRDTRSKTKVKVKSAFSVLVMIAGGVVLAHASMAIWDDIMLPIIFAILIPISAVFLMLAEKQNKDSIELRGKILGFKGFLEVAEVNKIKALVEEEPYYFFNILPFAFVFGLSKKWIDKFDDVIVNVPSWYSVEGADSALDYTTMSLYYMMWGFDSKLSSELTQLTASQIGDVVSDSDLGGGGFGGGGFGGGDGGSW